MQTVTAFVLLLYLIITSSAGASENPHCSVSKSADVSQIPWKINFTQYDSISLDVELINLSPSVIVNNLIVNEDGNISFVKKNKTNKWYYCIDGTQKTRIEIFLNESILTQAALFVAVRRDVSIVHQKETNKKFGLQNCLERLKYYRLTVDLKNLEIMKQSTTEQENLNPEENNNAFMKNETDLDNTKNNSAIGNNNAAQDSSQGSVLIYVLPPIVVSCVLILIIYLGVNKCRHRKSRPVRSIELDTYATANNVEYAELSMAHGDCRTLEFNENTPYAKIIGVMKPADRN